MDCWKRRRPPFREDNQVQEPKALKQVLVNLEDCEIYEHRSSDSVGDEKETSIKERKVSTPSSKSEAAFDEANSRKLKVVCVSDTHTMHGKLPFKWPKGDILLHAGDLTFAGRKSSVESWEVFATKLLNDGVYKYIILVGGNHDVTFHEEYFKETGEQKFSNEIGGHNCKEILALMKSTTYLCDESIIIEGVKIYASPWQPEMNDWAFNCKRGGYKLKEAWDNIPEDTDILLTHTPPHGHGDFADHFQDNLGCELLMEAVERIKPQFHVFGHIHEGRGHRQQAAGKTREAYIFLVENETRKYTEYQGKDHPTLEGVFSKI